MKNYTPLFIAIASIFSFSCYAQRDVRISANSKTDDTQLLADSMSNNDLAIVSYHVEERINMNFGSHITTYNVSSLSLVNTNDLGQNNTRVITPKYGKAKAVVASVINIQPTPAVATIIPVVQPVKVDLKIVEDKKKYVNIDILSTYERVIEKGYKSIDMLKRVGNGRFFDGDLVMAAKWYSQLFSMTTDLEPVYYYRYAQSLASIREIEKANEMMAIFENKNATSLN